jgi:hypothetical protein
LEAVKEEEAIQEKSELDTRAREPKKGKDKIRRVVTVTSSKRPLGLNNTVEP